MVRAAGRQARAAVAAPWAGVLALTTAFQVVRLEWVDTMVFGGALVLVLVDLLIPQGLGLLRGSRPLRSPPPLVLLSLLAGVVGVLLVVFPRHGIVSVVVLALVGCLVSLFSLAGDGRAAIGGGDVATARRWILRERRAAALWIGVIVAAGVVEASAFLLGLAGVVDDTTMPSISDVLDPVLDRRLWHACYVAVWLVTGVALLRRGGWTEVGRWVS